MNTKLKEGMELAGAVEKLGKDTPGDVLLVIAPPFTHLSKVREIIDRVILAAQNCSAEASGAYTGEISPSMLISAGAEYVILGHSERRSYFNETDEFLNSKVKLALSEGLLPIFCCGEVLSERESGNHFDVVRRQIEDGLAGISQKEMERIVIAYEPVWAIGTGETASPEQAQEMHQFIRGLVEEMHGEKTAADVSILYGGSCKPSNAGELFANPDVDGGLIGGASLKAEDFIAIAQSF